MMLTTRLFVFRCYIVEDRPDCRPPTGAPERCIPVAGSWPMMVSSAVGPLFSGSGMR